MRLFLAVTWVRSAVCNCDISLSYSLFFALCNVDIEANTANDIAHLLYDAALVILNMAFIIIILILQLFILSFLTKSNC